MNSLMTSGQSKHSKDILSHWLWTVPVLLIVAALTFRQIDLDPPTADEFYSMNNTGWLVNGPYSPIDVMQSLQRNSPNHTPGYFILLSIWGNLIGYDIALGRILTIFSGLLALAMTYRLTRDFVAPVAGLFALIIIASNAFYNFHIVYVRMYPLLVFVSGLALWLYLRIIHQQKQVKKTDYAALGIAVFALINTHAFSALFLAMLGIYHLLIVPKNRRWLWVSLISIIAALLFLPWADVLLSSGIDRTVEHWDNFPPLDSWGAVNIWLTLALNNQPGLLLLSIVGLALAVWKKKIAFKPYLIMFVFFLLTLALTAALTAETALVITPNMRHQLSGWLPFVLFAAAGFYSLYRFRKWLGLLTLLWIIAGAAFQRTPAWNPYVHDREYDQPESPIQVISRLALKAEQQPMIIAYRYARFLLTWTSSISYSQRDHYFDRHHLTLKLISDLDALVPYVRNKAIISPSQWIFHQTSKTSTAEAASIESIMRGLNYQLCDTLEIGIDTVLRQYAWQTLDCQPPRLLANHQTAAIDYQFYGAALQTSTVLFSDQWTARINDDLSGFQMSYQLISADWNKAAQLDLPLVHEGQPRLFAIDIADVPPGQYRLMAILYDKHSGQRQNWLNSAEDLPNMLNLTDIDIP